MTWIEALRDARDAINAAELQLGDAPVRASLDPKDLTLPGVWLKLDGLQGQSLCGEFTYALVTVYCTVATTGDVDRDLDAALQLLPLVATVIPPQSDPRHVALALPGAGTPATALSYAHNLKMMEPS